jgi:hypothetical protein
VEASTFHRVGGVFWGMGMRKISRIILSVVTLALVIFILLNLILALFGRQLAVAQIERALNLDVRLGSLRLGFPFSLKLSGLELGELAQVKEVSLSPSILGLLAGKIVLSALTLSEPVVTLVQSPEGRLNLPELKQRGKRPPLLIAGLVVKNGTLEFIDQKIDRQGWRVLLERINFKVSKLALPPTSLFTRFRLSADILDPHSQKLGSASASGWIDFGPKDMDGNFQLKDLQITYFFPYYGNFLSRKNLLSAKLNFNADLKAKNDDLKISCHLELADFVYGPEEEPKTEKDKFLALMPDALDLFRDTTGRVKMDFTIPTTLSNPRINILRFVAQGAQKNLTKDPENTIQKISNTVEKFKALGKSLKNIFEHKQEQGGAE